jgi:hypothetical protein
MGIAGMESYMPKTRKEEKRVKGNRKALKKPFI